MLDFPKAYIQKLETLMYPRWYTACFMQECRDSSVWGSYGVNHTAACLMFKVGDGTARPKLRVRLLSGWSSGGPVIDWVPHGFHEVLYENEHRPVDFFRSLGCQPVPVLSRVWYVSMDGRRSPCGDEMFKSEQAWRDRYWDIFYHGVTRKLKDWHYEKEHRLIIAPMMLNFSTPETRVAHYDFNDLAGIIFGMKTPANARRQVCKIVEEKCRETKRTDFKFYEAYYSQATGSIERREMSFLKFNFPAENALN